MQESISDFFVRAVVEGASPACQWLRGERRREDDETKQKQDDDDEAKQKHGEKRTSYVSRRLKHGIDLVSYMQARCHHE